ncbi:MAG: DNA/RNA nuclease SfsA [Synechococcaceae cyanobacterium RL_1_2]|nr:DNA/RNA nuclease SfsA [Synechococcaceae cyanobacterium RL_1_2]
MTNYLYTYPPLESGIIIKRYKRFLADIELDDGALITAHCPNTGPMLGVYEPGKKVQVSRSDNPKRKLPYTWEMIEIDGVWVGTNTAIPNRVVKLALEQQLIPELKGRYTTVKSEVPYGEQNKSRIDFLLTGNDGQIPIYVEVKNTTLTQGKLALFPDTVTTRGQKHLQELTALGPDRQGAMFYFVNRGDCHSFNAGADYDPQYADLLSKAIAAGVEVLPYGFEVSPQGIKLKEKLDFHGG